MAQARLTVDLDAIAANWTALDTLAEGAETGAVLKANAYGLGLEPVARTLWQRGARQFFVAQATEAPPLRRALGPEARIYVFAGYAPGDAEAWQQSGFMPLLNSPEQMAAFASAHPGAACGLQLDTGMNRLGLEAGDLAALDLAALDIRLVQSHLACADTPDHPLNAAQLACFRRMTQGLPGVPRSLAATGGILLDPAYHFDVTRPGIGLFGGAPFIEAQPVLRLDIPVIQTREVGPGEAVGYSAAWTAAGPCRIATLSAGYADGLLRAMGGAVTVYAGDVPCRSVGRMSMDLMTVDVSHLDTVPESLSLLGPSQSIDTVAAAAGTIGYEILTSLGDRYERVYKGGEPT